MKKCFKCGAEKPRSSFYSHSGMADGLLGKCKECTKTDARATRKNGIEYYRHYDRERGNRQDQNYLKNWRKNNKIKHKAHNLVNNAIRDGKLLKQPCEICSDEISHAHHDDYTKPLDIQWLCPAHHKEWHLLNGEGKQQ